MNSTDSLVSLIKNLRIWNGGNWIQITEKSNNLFLRLHYDQLIIMSENKVLESLNTVNMKLKGIIKDDVLILIINTDSQEVRKIKFQLKDNLLQILQSMQARFPIVSYGSMATIAKCKATPKYNDLENVFKSVLEDKGNLITLPMPENYKDFVKLCLLDPALPQVVQETWKIIEREAGIKENTSI